MSHQFAEIMFTDGVKAAQEEYGSRSHNKRFAGIAGPNDRLTDRETKFVAQRDTFYMATVNENGWPYVQHRGGPPGFLRVIDPTQLAYADFRGNTQLISVGNVWGANSNFQCVYRRFWLKPRQVRPRICHNFVTVRTLSNVT